MLENELLDGDRFLAFQKALDTKKQETIFFLIINIILLFGLFYWDVLNQFNLILGLVVGGISFLLTATKRSFVYYYIWENQTLTLFTMSRFGGKGQISFHKRSIKKIRAATFFFNRQGLLKIQTHTKKKAQEFTLLKNITTNGIQGIIKEIQDS